MTNLLEFDHIHYAYPNCRESLSGVTFSIKKGAKVALVGPNGAGKTTLLLMCNGVLEPSKGRVLFNSEPLRYDSRSLREVRKKVGLVFQNSDTQLFAPTVYQDVAFGPLNLGMTPDEIQAAVARLLAAVGLTGYEKRPPHQRAVARRSGPQSPVPLQWSRRSSSSTNPPAARPAGPRTSWSCSTNSMRGGRQSSSRPMTWSSCTSGRTISSS